MAIYRLHRTVRSVLLCASVCVCAHEHIFVFLISRSTIQEYSDWLGYLIELANSRSIAMIFIQLLISITLEQQSFTTNGKNRLSIYCYVLVTALHLNIELRLPAIQSWQNRLSTQHRREVVRIFSIFSQNVLDTPKKLSRNLTTNLLVNSPRLPIYCLSSTFWPVFSRVVSHESPGEREAYL
jgi:hypothetical protein